MAGFDISVLRLEKKKAKSKNECPPDIGSVCLHCRSSEPFGVFPVDGGAAAGHGGQGPLSCAAGGEPAARESFVVFNVLKWFICKTHTAFSASVLQPCPCALRRSAHSPPGHIAPGGPRSCHQRVVTATSVARCSGTCFPLSATGNHCSCTDRILNKRGPPLRSAELIQDAHLCCLEQRLHVPFSGRIRSSRWQRAVVPGLCPRGLCPAAVVSFCFKF